jgi:hypothetical protein
MGNKSSTSRIAAMYRRNVSVSIATALDLFSVLGESNGSKSDFAALQHARLIKGDHLGVLESSVSPETYSDAETYRFDYMANQLLSKYPYLDIKVDRPLVALNKFLQCEKQCSEANSRLSRDVSSIKSLYTPGSILSMARLKIASMLGPFSWDEAEPHFSFGPGSSTSLPRRKGDAYFKFGAAKPHVTKACSVLSLCAIKRIPMWFHHLAGLAGENPETLLNLDAEESAERLFTIVPGNRVTTVPKSAKTDRVIAIEPDLNMFIQKGIGKLLRIRLKRVGIDLDDQSYNQKLAEEGSITGKLCTMDLSSASDTVSMRLVEELLPSDWVSAIKLCRSPRGTLPDGTLLTYHKVSSMGNGFTFELESLIFWAICKSVIHLFKPEEDRLTVYGDDLIFSSQLFGTVSWVLTYCGFTVNEKKSFSDGPFRESCGKHFFKGVDVTPIYIKDDVNTPERLIWLANSIRRWVRLPTYGLDGRFKQVYDRIVSCLPKQLRKPSIPDGFGDIALIGDFDEARPQRSKHLQCWVAIGVSDVKGTFIPGEIPYMLRQLKSLENRPPSSLEVVTDNLETKALLVPSGGELLGVANTTLKRIWKIVKIPVTQWESYGGWLAP